VLKNRKLYYYKNANSNEKIKGVINFDQVQCYLEHTAAKKKFR
jgi:hypothetical protein